MTVYYVCRVFVAVKRVGGAFGAKIFRSHQIAAASAIAAYHTRKSVSSRLYNKNNNRNIYIIIIMIEEILCTHGVIMWSHYHTTYHMLCYARPVKIHLDLDTNMKMVGKRFPYYASYKVTHYPFYCIVWRSDVTGWLHWWWCDQWNSDGCLYKLWLP